MLPGTPLHNFKILSTSYFYGSIFCLLVSLAHSTFKKYLFIYLATLGLSYSMHFPLPSTYLFLIEGKLLHNVGLASAMHQHESVTGTHVSPLSLTSLPPPTFSHPSRLSVSFFFFFKGERSYKSSGHMAECDSSLGSEGS